MTTDDKPLREPEGDQPSTPDFEVSLSLLEEIVRKLERGELGLNESLAQYEKGVACLHACQQALDHAEARIQLLFKIDEDGNAHVREFEHQQDLSLEEKLASRSQRRSEVGESGPDDAPQEGELF